MQLIVSYQGDENVTRESYFQDLNQKLLTFFFDSVLSQLIVFSIFLKIYSVKKCINTCENGNAIYCGNQKKEKKKINQVNVIEGLKIYTKQKRKAGLLHFNFKIYYGQKSRSHIQMKQINLYVYVYAFVYICVHVYHFFPSIPFIFTFLHSLLTSLSFVY